MDRQGAQVFSLIADNLDVTELSALRDVSQSHRSLVDCDVQQRLRDQKLQWSWLYSGALTDDYIANERLLSESGAGTVTFSPRERALWNLTCSLLNFDYIPSEHDLELLRIERSAPSDDHVAQESDSSSPERTGIVRDLDFPVQKSVRDFISRNEDYDEIDPLKLSPEDRLLYIKGMIFTEVLFDAYDNEGISPLPETDLEAALLEGGFDLVLIALCEALITARSFERSAGGAASASSSATDGSSISNVFRDVYGHKTIPDLALRRYLDPPPAYKRAIATEVSVRDSLTQSSLFQAKSTTTEEKSYPLNDRISDKPRDLLLALLLIRISKDNLLFSQPFNGYWKRLMEHPVIIEALGAVDYDLCKPLPDNYEGDVELFGLIDFLVKRCPHDANYLIPSDASVRYRFSLAYFERCFKGIFDGIDE